MKYSGVAAVATAFALMLGGCAVEKTEDGAMPKVDVEGGKMPKYDVKTADIDINQTTATVSVPDVDIKTEKKEITVPDVNVTMPSEKK